MPYIATHPFSMGKVVMITYGKEVRSNHSVYMPPCLHEEADTRMLFHLKDMADNGYKKLCLKTVDSDVLVIMIGLFHAIKGKVDNVWVEYGVGKNMAYHNIKAASDHQGELKAKGLLFFHSFTGCDTTSSF